MDFTLHTYSSICSTLIENNYTVLTVNDYLRANALPVKTAVLRHDVDRKPATALRMAQLEHETGLKSTYYFRYLKDVFDPGIIKDIEAMGHEVGYHYETLSKCRGNMEKAILLFEKELEAFRKVCTVRTVSMHGRPLLPWDNRKLWDKASPQQFNLTGECYLSIDYQTIQYFSDTGRTWLPGKHNIRDHVQNAQNTPLLSSSSQLIEYLQDNSQKKVCILTHPNRWSGTLPEWLFSAGTDLAINTAKTLVVTIRKYTHC